MGIISTDLKPYYSEDRTDRIRTIGGPPVLLTKDDNSHEKSLLIDKVSQLPLYQCSGSLTAAYIEALALAKREINLLTTFDD